MRFLREKSAMEMLEAAITTPIAILVMLAIINFGVLVYAQQAVQAAARAWQAKRGIAASGKMLKGFDERT